MTANQRYFFYDLATGNWIVGRTLKSKLIAGFYEQIHEVIVSMVNGEPTNIDHYGLRSVSSDQPRILPRVVTDWCDANGDPYPTYADFEAATKDFFFRVGATSGSGFGSIEFTGDGVTTDFSMPADCDIYGDIFVEGEYSVSLLMVGLVKTARFSVAPTTEQYPRIAYTKTGIPVTTTGSVTLTDDHTLTLANAEKTLYMDSALAKTLTIPLHVNVAIPIDTRNELFRWGAGTFKVIGDTGVTIKYDPDGTGLVAAGAGGVYVNSAGTLTKQAENVWILLGVLTAV